MKDCLLILPVKWLVKEHVGNSNYNLVTAFYWSLFNAKSSWNEGAQRR